MIRTYLIWYVIGLMITLIYSVEYNQRCTFSSGTCDWNIGRRWQVQNLDDQTDDQVLIATDRSNQDKEMGFTDVVTSSWLYLTSACSFDIQLTFQFSIENDQDQIEVFLVGKDHLQISSIGQWKALTDRNTFEDIESLWQQANITFKATEQFQIEFEIRHFPDNRIDSTTWFALDDILIQTCSEAQTTTITTTITTTTTTSTTTKINEQTTIITLIYDRLKNSSLLHNRIFHRNENSTQEEFLSSHLTLFGFVLYIISTFIALALITIFLVIVIFTYRKRCLPSTNSLLPITNHRIHSKRRRTKYHHSGMHNNHIDQDARTERTMVTTIRA